MAWDVPDPLKLETWFVEGIINLNSDSNQPQVEELEQHSSCESAEKELIVICTREEVG